MNSGDRVTGTSEGAGKVRLYEVAKDLGINNKDLVDKIRALGIEVKNHMSNVDAEVVARVKRALDKERQANLVEERLTSTVIRRRTRDGSPVRREAPPPVPAETPVVRRTEPARPEPQVEVPAHKPEPLPEPIGEAREVPVEAEPPRAAEPAHKPEPVREREPEPRPEPRAAEPARPAEPVAEPREEAPAAEKVAEKAPDKAPEKKEEPRFGPTGRVIELPRIEIRQADARYGQRRVAPDPRGMGAQQRDRFGRGPSGPGGQQRGQKRTMTPAQPGKKGKQTQITTPAAHKRVVKMDVTIAVAELAKQMGIKATDVLKKLWSMGMVGINLNSNIDQDAATLVAGDFGFEIESTAFQESEVIATVEDRPEDLRQRAPVVTIMGHVDHGKTSLLDAIRDANVAAGEAGGITQHIGAYKITAPDGNPVVFLDTPGHEAFTAMRARGAQATDIVVLVVAADDGVMPTTVEALNHAKEAKVSVIVAVNKIDKAGANPERVRQQLSEHGLIPEQWGGETIYVDVSARTKQGIDQLLQMLSLQSEVLELKANPDKLAKGIVVEAKLDRNRGPMATVLVQEGTLKVGDTVVAGEFSGKVRAMLDDKGRQLAEAGPSTPVEILGIAGVPDAGEVLNAVADEKQVKELIEHRREARRRREMGGSAKVSLENILERIKEGAVKELKIVLKADVQGSAEALKAALNQLSTAEVRVEVIQAGVGGITESDINLAKAGNAIVVGFHVRPAGKAAQLAEQEGVDVKLYDIIYEALDDVKKAMAGLLAPVRREKTLGKVEVRQTFNIPKVGTIAGCFVQEGLIRRNASVRLVRDSVSIWQGKLASLRRFKDDVREVVQGYECGVGLEGFNDLKEGDVIEVFEIEEVAATL